MHSIQINSIIERMISFFYCIRFWHRGDVATVRELRIKWFYCIYHFLFVVSLVMGAIQSDNKDDCIFLAETAVTAAVLLLKLWVLIWKQKQILDLFNRICIFSVRSQADFVCFNDKLQKFMKFVKVFVICVFVGVFLAIILPFLGSEKILFLKIAFPLDWKNNKFAFHLANAFVITEILLTLTAFFFSVMIWYLMLNCSVRYEVLGNWLTKLGHLNEEFREKKVTILDKQKQNFFLVDLTASIDDHLHIREY